nr:ER membrane protein complex subunit 3-like [Ipomoea batatas]
MNSDLGDDELRRRWALARRLGRRGGSLASCAIVFLSLVKGLKALLLFENARKMDYSLFLKVRPQNTQAQMLSDPNMAMDMMRKICPMIIPQTLTFAWVNFFFSGFVGQLDVSTVHGIAHFASPDVLSLMKFSLSAYITIEPHFNFSNRISMLSELWVQKRNNLDIVQHDWALPKFEQTSWKLS